MIVEDDPDDLLLIQRALRRARVENPSLIARDGAEALRLLIGPDALPDLPIVVLLDLKLPLIDGMEVLRTVRSDPRTKALPVVILTSSDEQEDLLRGYDLGVNSYVRKPIDFAPFQEIVGQLGLYWVLINRIPRRD
jgi:two-component system response regulator